MNLNNVTLVGNLTRDPESRQAGESTVCKFGLAVNRKGKTPETCYIDVECWGRTAEVADQYAAKGSQVGITGRLKLDQWEDKDGNKRSKLYVVADTLQLGARPEGDQKPNGGGRRERSYDAPALKDSDIPF